MVKILIVDDEKIERNGIKFLLKQVNQELEVIEAVNGLKALDMLEKEKVDILLTDIKMPFMDGMELIQEVKKREMNMKIIIFSGYGEFEYARLAMKNGVSNYILKPVDPQEFFNTMEKVLKEIEDEKLDKELKEKEMTFFKEHILLSMITGVAGGDTSSSDKIIDKDKIKNYHYMMMIEFIRDFFGVKAIDFTDILSEVINIEYQYLNISQQQSVLLFPDEKMERRKTAISIIDKIKRYYGDECYISVSEYFENNNSLPKVYEELEAIMENRFYVLEDKVFLQNDKRDDTDFDALEEDKLMKKIKQDIKLKDMVGLKQHFEQLCSKYQSKKNFSQVYVKFIFSNLLKDIYETLPDIESKLLNSEIDKLYRATEFTTVIEILQNGIEIMEKNFAVNPQMTHREIETVKQYIYANYNKEISVDMLAEQVYMAPSYLSHIFKKETGQNLSKFIKALRMEKAKEMLEESHNKIVNISYAVGYPNVSYFCQSFREYFGVSPQKYRKQGETDEINN